ncbi:MAG: manganese efflux pump [Sedimentisphaerales bacterium]|nr:manganese efflux pump [Sedimentisphaerales bacterium]
MEYISVIIIAVGLAMDAFAVSVASGAAYKQLHVKHAFRMAAFFGGFQAFMPLIGALAGLSIKSYIQEIDHWIAFAILSVIGGKMIYEAFKIAEAEKNCNPSNILVLLTLSVATSIDALVVGITLSLVASNIIVAVIIIGLITFILSYMGVYIGKKFGHFFENKIEALGGFVLIALGIKILIEHLFFN